MSGELRPRLCVLEKGSDGYGFHLHGEKNKAGQFIRLVEPDSAAELSGLRAGDKLAFVNGESVEGESHQQVVSRIRTVTGKLELIVVDSETAEYLKKHNLTCKKEFVSEGVPRPGDQPGGQPGDQPGDQPDTAAQESNGTATESSPAPASTPSPAPSPSPTPVPAANGSMGLDTLSLSSKVNLDQINALINPLYPLWYHSSELRSHPRYVPYHCCVTHADFTCLMWSVSASTEGQL